VMKVRHIPLTNIFYRSEILVSEIVRSAPAEPLQDVHFLLAESPQRIYQLPRTVHEAAMLPGISHPCHFPKNQSGKGDPAASRKGDVWPDRCAITGSSIEWRTPIQRIPPYSCIFPVINRSGERKFRDGAISARTGLRTQAPPNSPSSPASLGKTLVNQAAPWLWSRPTAKYAR
jgi:hypothetical protein